MDVIEQARSRCEPQPAQTAATDCAETAATPPRTMANVIGSLHSGDLVALTMELARQRSRERATRNPTPIG